MLNKKKERELAYVVKIDNILPIEGAERVEQAACTGEIEDSLRTSEHRH